MMGKSKKNRSSTEDTQQKRSRRAKVEPLRPQPGKGRPAEKALRAANRRLRASEAKLRRSQESLRVRNEIAEVFLTLSGSEMFGEVLRVILAAVKSKYGVFGYIDEDGALVCPSMTMDVWEKCEIANKSIVFPQDEWGDSLWSRAIREKRSLYSNKPSNVPAGHIAIFRNLAIPLIYEHNVVGLIHVANKPADYDADDVELLEDIAGHVIAPVLHTRLERDAQEKKRRRAESELAAEQKLLRIVIDNIPDRIYVKDRDSRFILYNAAVANFWQLASPDELIGKRDFDLYDRQLASKYYAEEQQVMRTGQPVLNRPSPGTDSRGNLKWCLTTRVPLLDNGSITGIVGVSRDITEQKKAADALRAERDRAQKYLDVAGVMFVALDADGRVTLINKKGCEVLGYEEADIVGRNWFDNFLPETDRAKVKNAFARLMSGEIEPVEYFENPVLTKAGEERLIAWHNTVWRSEAGEISGTLGSGEDITERKQAEQELTDYHGRLKRLASQLALAEERQRRRIAGEFHDTVSQSLALAKIKLDVLQTTAASQEPKEVLAEVAESLGEAIRKTRSLTFDLSYPILYELGFEAAVEEWLEENVGHRYGIKTAFYDDGSEKLLDDDVRVLLFRNVRELLTNVIKHSNAKKVKVSVRKIDDEIQVAVKDDGVGFDVERQVATAGRNAEFGLLSIRERIEDIGGKLEIDSSPGGGCAVTMTVPVNNGQIETGG